MPVYVVYSWDQDASCSYDAVVCAKSSTEADHLMFILFDQYLDIKDPIVVSTEISLNNLSDLYKELNEDQLFLEQYSRKTHRRIENTAKLLTIKDSNKITPSMSSKLFNELQNSIIPPILCLVAGSLYSVKFRFGMMMFPVSMTGALIIKYLAFVYSAHSTEMVKKDIDYIKRVNAVTVFYMCLIVPLKEELQFRMFAHNILRYLWQYTLVRYAKLLPFKSSSSEIVKWMAIVSSAMVFGYAHKGNPVQVLYNIYIGIINAMLYESKGFFASLGLHMAQNLLYPVYKQINLINKTQKRKFPTGPMPKCTITHSWAGAKKGSRLRENTPPILYLHFDDKVTSSLSNKFFQNNK